MCSKQQLFRAKSEMSGFAAQQILRKTLVFAPKIKLALFERASVTFLVTDNKNVVLVKIKYFLLVFLDFFCIY